MIIMLSGVCTGHCQNEMTWWYFGGAAGVEFTADTAAVNTDANYPHTAGCGTMSDSTGNLLFYFGDSKIWNRNHEVMPNGGGLFWEIQSEGSTAIVPFPEHPDQYFVFTTDGNSQWINGNGLFYHLVDMSLDSGMGDVVGAVKNVVLQTYSEEKLTLTQHANGIDYWLAVREPGPGKINLYLIDDQGINTNPVTTNLGVNTTSYLQVEGTLRFNHSGTKMAHCIADSLYPKIELFDFDNSTGILSNLQTLQGHPYGGHYGLEFSPDDSKLYTSGPIQFDLTDTALLSIQSSMTYIGGSTQRTAVGLQLALDGKIYATSFQGPNLTDYMDIIHCPNETGLFSNYEEQAIYLNGRHGGVALPEFPSSWFRTNINSSIACTGDTSFFFVNFSCIDSVLWNFGDPSSGTADTSTQLIGEHIYSNAGTYTITLIAQNGVKIDTVEIVVEIEGAPLIDLGNDTLICMPFLDSIILDPGSQSGDYLWNTGSTDTTLVAYSIGMYSLSFTNHCGTYVDSIGVLEAESPIVSLINPDSLCNGDTLFLDVTQPNTTYLWSDSSTNGSYFSTQSGTHWVTVYGICDTISDSTHVEFWDCPWPEGISETGNRALLIYPNPTSSKVHIQNSIEEGEVEIMDLLGATRQKFDIEPGLNTAELNAEIPTGTYLYRFISENSTESGILIVNRK